MLLAFVFRIYTLFGVGFFFHACRFDRLCFRFGFFAIKIGFR